MRSEPLLTAVPPAPVRSRAELYAIALTQAKEAAQRYGQLGAAGGETFAPVGCVFEILSQREGERASSINETSIAAIGRPPDHSDLQWTPIDLVPSAELSDIGNSLLSTPYGAWALAVRHRQRAFVFWTYISALAEAPSVCNAAEDMARQALRDGNLLRRERRLAWRAEQNKASTDESPTSQISSAALLESLLLKEIFRWSQDASASQRDTLLSLIGSNPSGTISPDSETDLPHRGTLEDVKRRALRRAEQLSSIYLDEADSAHDQSQLELAQQLATRSIARLADLRAMASAQG